MFEIFFLSFLTSVYFISAGIFFSVNILDIKIKNETNIFKIALYGCIFLSFFGLLLNYFINLSKVINIIILISFLIYLIISQKKNLLKKVFTLSLLIAVCCSFLIINDNTYRPDAGLYHLPYVNIINTEKIIIGISNIHFRFGHTSIIQYISALNNNWIFSNNGVLLPTAIIYICFLFYLIYEIKFSNNKNLIFFNFLILSFLCLKLNRYSDFGNDAPAHIYYFLLTSLAFKYYKKLELSRMGEIAVISAYLVYNKITLFLGSLVTIIFLAFKKKIYFFNIKPIIFILLFTFIFFTKNFLVSGCAAFPIKKTCVSSFFWYDFGSNRGTNAEKTMFENEAWTKGWSDQKSNIKTYEQYLSDYDWIKVWFNGHGKRTLNKLTPFLIFVIFIYIFILFNKNDYKVDRRKYYKNAEKNFILSLIILNFTGILMWFLKFPVFRYGYSYSILFIILLIVLLSYNKIESINIFKLKKKINYIMIFLIIILFTKNFIRIVKNYDANYNQAPWPKIYSEDKKNLKKENIPVFIDGEIIYYYSSNSTCYFNTAPCTHINFFQNSSSQIKLKRKFGYKIFYFDRENLTK